MSEHRTVAAQTITTNHNNNSNSSMHSHGNKFYVKSLQPGSSDKLVTASPSGENTFPTTSDLTSEENNSNVATLSTSWSSSILSLCSNEPPVYQMSSSMLQPSSEENMKTRAAASTLSSQTLDANRGTIFSQFFL